MNLSEILEQQARKRGDAPFFVDLGQSFTYEQVSQLSDKAIGTFKEKGIKEGDHVLLQLFNSAEFIVTYFALLRLNAVVVPVSTSFKQREVFSIIEDASPQLIIQHRSIAADVDLKTSNIPIILISDDVETPDFSWLISNVGTEIQIEKNRNEDDVVVILYSSGTTGIPKGVMLTNRNLVTNMLAAARCYQMTEQDSFVLFLPMFHCFGLNAILNCTVHCGASMVIMRQFSLLKLQSILLQWHITMFFAVPFIFNLILKKWKQVEEFRNTVYFFSAASKLALETEDSWLKKYGIPIYQGYGLTETSPFATYMPKENYRRGSVGIPIADVEIAIDQSGYTGGNGEILIKGPNVMKGYFNRNEQNQVSIKDDWFYSGDIGRIDDEGFLFIEDRKKDIIIVKGRNVFPSEVENIIMEMKDVDEVAVFGVTDPLLEEHIYARVLVKPNSKLSAELITEYCSKQIADYKVPVNVRLVDSLPKSASGKLLKRVMQEEEAGSFNFIKQSSTAG